MSNWKITLEEFEEDFKKFLDCKYDSIVYEDVENAYNDWASLLDLAEVVLENLEQRLVELEEAKLDIE